eukprot:Tbor_TRINITY_DN4682_c0_g1::TRINITY_DN4682_c0_g1_i1::g.14972::m.14972
MSGSLPISPGMSPQTSSFVCIGAVDSDNDITQIAHSTLPERSDIRCGIEYAGSSWDICVIDEEADEVSPLVTERRDKAVSPRPQIFPTEQGEDRMVTSVLSSPVRIVTSVVDTTLPQVLSNVTHEHMVFHNKKVIDVSQAPSAYWPPSPFTLAVGVLAALPMLWICIYTSKHIQRPSAQFKLTPNTRKKINEVIRLFSEFHRSISYLVSGNNILCSPVPSPSVVLLQPSSCHLIKSVESFVDQVKTILSSSVAWSGSFIRDFSQSSFFEIPSLSNTILGISSKDRQETPVRLVINNSFFYCEVVLPRFMSEEGIIERDEMQAYKYGLRSTNDVFSNLLDGTISNEEMRAIFTHMMVHHDPRHLLCNVIGYTIEASCLLEFTDTFFRGPKKHVKLESCEDKRCDGQDSVVYITTTTEITERPTVWWSKKNLQVLMDSVAAVGVGVFGGIVGGLGSTILFDEYQKRRFLSFNRYSRDIMNIISERLYNTLSNDRRVVVGGSAVVHSFGGFVCGYGDKPLSFAVLISADIAAIIAMLLTPIEIYM